MPGDGLLFSGQRKPDALTSLSFLSWTSDGASRCLNPAGGPHRLHTLALGASGEEGRACASKGQTEGAGHAGRLCFCCTVLSGIFGNEHLPGRRPVCLDIFANVITLQKSKVLSPVQGGFPVLLIKLWNIETG